jgi:hypothetical protein
MHEKVDAWNAVLGEMDRAEDELRKISLKSHDNCEFWYRGQMESKWPLVPSLFRGIRLPGLWDAKEDRTEHRAIWTEIWEGEQDLYYEFAARARELHGSVEDWDILFAMQQLQAGEHWRNFL